MSKLTIMAAVAGLFLVGCHKKQIQSTEDKLTSGTWKVSSFVINNSDKTNGYDDDVYQFNQDGTIAVSGAHTASGNYNVNGISDATFERMQIDLRLEGNCAALTGSWSVTQETNEMIRMEEFDEDHTNYLILTKNYN